MYKIKKSKKAFTIAELLLSLALMAFLMAAMAVALHASSVNYNNNRDMYEAINAARMAMYRMTTDIRGAIVNNSEPSSQCSMVTADNRNITYKYDSAQKTLYVVVNAGPNAGTYTLCKNITVMNFERSAKPLDPTAIRSVRITMTVTTDTTTQKLCAGVVARKNL